MQTTRFFRVVIGLALPVCASACQPTWTATPEGSRPTEAAGSSFLNATPYAFTDPLSSRFELLADQPVIPAGPVWDNGLMMPASVAHHDGRYYLFYNGLLSIHLAASIGYATSPDGIVWTKQSVEKPVLTLDDIHRDPAPWTLAAGSVLLEGDSWVMYMAVSPLVHASFRGIILRATAPSPEGPWTVDPDPVLSPGAEGEWDSFAIGLGDVIPTADGYRMYYVAGGGMGLATSPDGIVWTKYDDPSTTDARRAHSDPVFAGFMESPTVQPIPGGWALVYRTADGFFYDTSTDGIHWQPGTTNPILTQAATRSGMSLTSPKLYMDGQKAFLFFEGGFGNYSRLYCATWEISRAG